MAKKEREHIIEKHIVNLEIDGTDNPDEINDIQQNIIYFIKDRVGNELNKILDNLSIDDIDIQLDNVEIDLDNLSFDNANELEQKIVQQFKEKADKVIQKKIKEVVEQKAGFKGKKKRFSKVFIVEKFLKTGVYPAWASQENGSIQEIIDELLSTKPRDFISRLAHLSKNRKARERIYYQFNLTQLQHIFSLMYSKHLKEAKKQIDLIKKRFGSKSEKTIYAAAILLATEQKSVEFKERLFNKKVVQEIQQRNIKEVVASKIRPGFEGQYKDYQILDYFLRHGAIPSWSAVDSSTSLQELFQSLLDSELVRLQSMVELNFDSRNFIKRLVYQFSTKSILQLLEPISADNLAFIEDCIDGFAYLSTDRPNVQQKISKNKIRSTVLNVALDYYFKQKKVNLVKKSVLQQIISALATASKTDADVLIKESYKSNRHKKSSSIKTALRNLDTTLQSKLNDEKKELRDAKKTARQLQRSIQKLSGKNQEKLSAADQSNLRRYKNQLSKLERKIEGLEDADMPLEIELLLQHQQDLKLQLQGIGTDEQDKLNKRLADSNQSLIQLQEEFSKEIDNLLRDKEKLNENIAKIAESRIKRVNKRLSRYQRAVKNVIAQYQINQKDLIAFLGNINKALRGNISNEEKKALRQQRKQLQDELIALNKNIEELQAKEAALIATLQSAVEAIDAEDEQLEATPTSKLDALIFMLKFGATPWWAKDFPRQSIEELFVEFARESPDQLKRSFQQIGRYPAVWERAVNQLSEASFSNVVKSLYPSESRPIFAMADLLGNLHFSQGFEQLRSVDPKKFKWGIIFEYLLGTKQSFTTANFYRDISLQTARMYQLSPTQLVEYSFNIIQNRKGDMIAFKEWNRLLTKDKKVAEIERDLIAQRRKRIAQEKGLDLTDAQKLELLTDYFSNGYIDERAKSLQYDSIKAFEKLLMEQIQKNKASTKQALSQLIRLASARSVLVKELSPAAFWEVVHLIKPRAFLITQRYFRDFAVVYKDSNLYAEKDALLTFFNANKQENFEISEFLRTLLVLQQRLTSRKMIAILMEWKQKIIAGGGGRSSWLLSVIMMELHVLKEEQKQSNDKTFISNIQQQMEALAKEYTELSRTYASILTEENAEMKGLADKNYKLKEIEDLIEQHKLQIEELQQSDTDALKTIEKNRRIALLKAQLKLLMQKRPPLLRATEAQTAALKKEMEQLDKQIAQEKEVQGAALSEEKATSMSIKEQQLQLLDLLSTTTEQGLTKLASLLEQLDDAQQSSYRYILLLEKTIDGITNADYKKKALELLEPYLNIKPTSDAAHAQQQKLLQQIGQEAPFKLWEGWDALELFFKNNPEQLTDAAKATQKDIFSELMRLEQQNVFAFVQSIREAQQTIENELDKAQSKEAIDAVAATIQRVQKFQTEEIDALIQSLRGAAVKADLRLLKDNLEQQFVKLENRRKRYAYSIYNKKRVELIEKKEAKEKEIDKIEEQKAFILDEIRKEEEPEENPFVEPPKPKKRKQKPPVVEEIKEPLIIYNAGLVLLWPYLSRLFKALKYVQNKDFVSVEAQYKAIHLLQYLATGRTEAPENELILNKVFCKFPITEPVPFGVEFEPGELNMAEGLLKGAINNWPKMKNMSPNSLRGSFLIREGTIEEVEDKWLINVTKKPFDVLLKSLPWGFTFINLPWLQKFISVEWKLL